MFKAFESRPITRKAHLVVASDVIINLNESTATLQSSEHDETVTFKHYEPVNNGDYIVFLNEDDVYHCNATVFAEHNILDSTTADTGSVSDGYHTFDELYDFRKVYNALLFNEWAKQSMHDVHKSTKHADGEDCFGGGWFIVMATLPTGQISNHYEMKDWDLFKCISLNKADLWDGHTAKDVLGRMKDFLG